MMHRADSLRQLSFLLKVANVDAVRISSGRLFQAARSARQYAWLPRRRLVCGTSRSSWAAEHRLLQVVNAQTVKA